MATSTAGPRGAAAPLGAADAAPLALPPRLVPEAAARAGADTLLGAAGGTPPVGGKPSPVLGGGPRRTSPVGPKDLAGPAGGVDSMVPRPSPFCDLSCSLLCSRRRCSTPAKEKSEYGVGRGTTTKIASPVENVQRQKKGCPVFLGTPFVVLTVAYALTSRLLFALVRLLPIARPFVLFLLSRLSVSGFVKVTEVVFPGVPC